MSLPAELLDFARQHRDELTLSVYIESAPHDPAARRDWRVRLRQGLADVRRAVDGGSAEERDAFERCAAAVLTALPEGEAPHTCHGWACFAAASGHLAQTFVASPVETTVRWGTGTRLVPLLLANGGPRALVARIDHEGVRLHRLNGAWLDEVARIETPTVHDVGTHMGDAPARGFHAGTRGRTGTDEAQRQRREALGRLIAEAADRLIGLARHDDGILIVGTEELSKRLMAALPEALREHTALVEGVAAHQDLASVTRTLRETLAGLAASRRDRRLHALHEAAHAHGRAATGYRAALAAVAMGAIAELVLSERAWRNHPDEIEALVQRALFEGADVAVAGAAVALDLEPDGIIAGLRWPLPVAS